MLMLCSHPDTIVACMELRFLSFGLQQMGPFLSFGLQKVKIGQSISVVEMAVIAVYGSASASSASLSASPFTHFRISELVITFRTK